MQSQIELSIMNKEIGIEASLKNANRCFNGWEISAIAMLKDFLAEFGESSFMAEDVRNYATSKGLPEPESNRAWGGVMVNAKNEKLIKSIGFGLTKNALAHRTPATLWKKA